MTPRVHNNSVMTLQYNHSNYNSVVFLQYNNLQEIATIILLLNIVVLMAIL